MTQNPTLDEYKSWTDDERAEFLRSEAGRRNRDPDRHEAALDDALEWVKEYK